MLDSDKLILLNVIKTGNYQRVLLLKSNFDHIKTSHTSYKLKQNVITYRMANNITNILLPTDNIKLKKNLNNLIATELNYYQKGKEQDRIYNQLKLLSSNLVAFPTSKRLSKFLISFVKASKVLQQTVLKENNLEFLKTLKILAFEVRKDADSE